MKRILALVAALCLASLLALPAEAPKPVRVLVTLSGQDAGAVADAYASLSTGLASSPLVLAVYVSGQAASEDGQSIEAMCRLFIDLRLTRTEEGETASWGIGSRVDGNELIRGEAVRSSSSPAWSDASFWQPLVDAIPEALAAIPADTIIVRAKAGTEVSGIGVDFSMPPSGEIELPVDIPALYSWNARIPGAYPESGSAYVKEGGTSLDIPYRPLTPAKRWSIDSSFYSFAFPAVSASYSPSPSWSLRATITQFFIGLSLTDAAAGFYPSLTYSTGLVQSGLGALWYPIAGKGKLQPYFGLDLFLRLIFPDGGGIAIEPIAPFGVAPFVGLEWSRIRDLGVFLELGAAIYPVADRDFMLASAGDASGRLLFGGGGLFPGHPGWFGEFPIARFGLRLKL